MSSLWTAASDLQTRTCPFVVVTLVSVRGSAPQEPGAKAIVISTGLHWGTVGGGKVEARAIEHARGLLAGDELGPTLVTWNLQRDIGMSCGGEATFLFEIHHAAAWRVAVFGAGHVGQAVVRTLIPLNSHVSCIDPRPEWLSKLPDAENLRRIQPMDCVSAVSEFDDKTFFVVMTQGHATDKPVLEQIFRRFPNAPYVGVMGSELKSKKIRKELMACGLTAEIVSRLHSPIGLRLGGNHPFEIAVSVVAELIQARDEWLALTATRRQKDPRPCERDTEQTLL